MFTAYLVWFSSCDKNIIFGLFQIKISMLVLKILSGNDQTFESEQKKYIRWFTTTDWRIPLTFLPTKTVHIVLYHHE